MKPKPKMKTHQQPMLGTMRLDLALDMDHELVRLAQTINWEAIAAEFRPMYCPNNGRPAVPTRLMAGLQLYRFTPGTKKRDVYEWLRCTYGVIRSDSGGWNPIRC